MQLAVYSIQSTKFWLEVSGVPIMVFKGKIEVKIIFNREFKKLSTVVSTAACCILNSINELLAWECEQALRRWSPAKMTKTVKLLKAYLL